MLNSIDRKNVVKKRIYIIIGIILLIILCIILYFFLHKSNDEKRNIVVNKDNVESVVEDMLEEDYVEPGIQTGILQKATECQKMLGLII